MIIGDFLDGVGVLIDCLVHLLGADDEVLELAGNSELFLLFCTLDGVHLVLVLVVLVGLLLHD